jgi:methyl-accepting chemotaxis protein
MRQEFRYAWARDADEARVSKSRFVWLSRMPFLVAALLGGAALAVLKHYAVDQLYITASACAIIVAYWAIVATVPALRIREDQLGDNCYYLGFLFTLASLAYALYQFGLAGSSEGSVEQIVANFGLALGSTITGILLRVLINQARRDVLETEQDARMALADAVVRLRTEIDDAVLAMGAFCRAAQQIAGEQIGTAAKETAGVLERSVARVGDTSQAAIRQIDSAFGQFHDHAAQLNATAGATAEAMGHMLSTIESATEALRHLDHGLRTVADHAPHGLDHAHDAGAERKR